MTPLARGGRLLVGLLLALALVAGLLMISQRAMALIKVPEAQAGLVSLWTDNLPMHFVDLSPGEEGFARIDVNLEGADSGELYLQLRKSGALAEAPGGLVMDVMQCDEPWTNVPTGTTTGVTPACAANRQLLVQVTDADDLRVTSPVWDLEPIERGVNVHLLLRVGLPATTSASVTDGLDAQFEIGLLAEGLGGPVTPAAIDPAVADPRLAVSGADVAGLALVAIGAIGLGILVRLSRSRRDQEVAS